MIKQELVAEIGQPMYDGLIELRNNFRKFGWRNARTCRERSNAERIVVEAEKDQKLHWFQVAKNGDISPCVTYMNCR